MKVLSFAALTVALIMGFPQEATAAEFEGAGLSLCSEFVENVQKDPQAEDYYFSWAEGLISGANIARLNDEPGAFKTLPARQQEAHLWDFCNKNPHEKFYKAVFDLYITLYPKIERLNVNIK